MSNIAQNNRISNSEKTGKFPWKKTVRWSTNLVQIHEYEKPFRKGSYGELSEKLGKPVRVLGKPERVLGKAIRVPVKMNNDIVNSCICT